MKSTGAQLATEKTEDDAAQRTDVQSQSVHKVGESTVLQEEPSSSQVAEEDVGLDTLLSELKLEPGETQAAARQPLLDSFDLKGIAERIRSGET